MTPTQQHLLKLVLEIDRICKKYDIQYFIDYGTVLGAIRHEGFIPWDDDLDIMLTEDNYYKWVEACRKELDPEKRNYNDVRLDREFPTVFGRYNDLESARVGAKSEFWKPICGQCIDVFYLLPLPGDPVKKQEAIDRYYAYDEYSNSSYRHYKMKTPREMELYRKYTKLGHKIGKEKVLQMLEKQIFHQHYDDCDTYICTSARRSGPSSLVPKEYYDSVYMADFEGYKLPVPGKYVELMNTYYEDTYCMIPEHKKQHSKQSDTNIGCAVYVNDYMRLIDKDQMLADRQKFKDISVEEGYLYTVWSREVFEKLGKLELLRINRKIKSENLKLEELLVPDDEKKQEILEDLFGAYYKSQMNSTVRYYRYYFDIGDELLYAALYHLIYGREDYYSAAKILELRQRTNEPLPESIKDLWNIILTSRKVKAETIYGNYEKARRILTQGREKYPKVRDLAVCEMNLDVLEASCEEDYRKCENEIQTLLNRHPDDDQCIKARGDIALKRGDLKEAQKNYDWVNEHSLNGMLHMDIKRKLRAYHD